MILVSRRTVVVRSVVLVLSLIFTAGARAGLRGLVMNETAIIEDNYGLVNLDDVDDRDGLRAELSKKKVLFANNFVEYMKSGQWRNELRNLVDPSQADTFPSSIAAWFEQLEPIQYDGTWDDEDEARLDKIRTAMALKGLMDFAAPGTRRPAEIDGEIDTDVLDAYLGGGSDGVDPAFLQRIREFEDQYKKLFVIKVEGTDGLKSTPQPDVEGIILSMMNAATADVVNPPSQGDVDTFVQHVLSRFVNPSEQGWRINPGWWNLTHAGGSLVSEAGRYNTVAGAQLLGFKLDDIDIEHATADEVIEALTTAKQYSLKYSGRTYLDAAGVNGVWTSGDEMVFTVGSVDSTGLATNTAKVLERVELKSDPIDIVAADLSESVSGISSVIPELPLSEELLLLLKLIDAFQEPAENVPATESDFNGNAHDADTGDTFGGGGPLGGSF